MSRVAYAPLVDCSALPTDLLIGGAWVPGSSGRRIDVSNPSTEAPIASVADATVEDGLAAVTAASNAFPVWAATAPRERGEILRRAFELITQRLDWFAELISLENGKALADAVGEIKYAAEFFRWYSEEAVRINGHVSIAPSGANRILVQYQPVGVSVLVTPWNFPAAMATRKIGPALAAVARPLRRAHHRRRSSRQRLVGQQRAEWDRDHEVLPRGQVRDADWQARGEQYELDGVPAFLTPLPPSESKQSKAAPSSETAP